MNLFLMFIAGYWVGAILGVIVVRYRNEIGLEKNDLDFLRIKE